MESTASITLTTTLFLVFGASIVGGIVARKMRLPMLIGYIASGVLFGNVFTGFIDESFIELISEIGVTLLLFTLGVEFSFHRLRKILQIVGGAALVQILVILTIFTGAFILAGFDVSPAMFLAAAASLSSTAVVIKVLSEKGTIGSIYGEVLTGWLVVQDLAVVPIMILLPVLSSIGVSKDQTLVAMGLAIGASILKAAVFLITIVLLGRHIIPRVLSFVAKMRSREIFLLVTVGIVFLAATVSFMVGLSAALGAFIAGLLIAETSQNHAIFAEVRPLRDLFAVVFFVSLGMVIPVSLLWSQAVFLGGFAVSILLIKFLLSYGLVRFIGYHKKTSFSTAIGLASMSEFGFIIAKEGLSLGVLSQDEYVLGVALTFLAIVVSAPMLSNVESLYFSVSQALGKHWVKFFPNTRSKTVVDGQDEGLSGHIIICGYGRVGRYVGRAFELMKIPFVVVEYNFSTVARLKKHGVPVVYGDPADRDVLVAANVSNAKAVVIAIPDKHTQEMVIANAQTMNKSITIICRSHHEEDQKRLKSLGVSFVVQPEFEASVTIASRLLSSFGKKHADIAGKIARLKIEHGLG